VKLFRDRWAVVAYNNRTGEELAVVSRHVFRRWALAFCQEMERASNYQFMFQPRAPWTNVTYRVREIPRPIPDAEDCWSGNWDGEIR
jgi:hypothetical protein